MPMPVQEFTEFASAVTHRLLRSAYLLTGDLAAAEDLVQEALLRTFRYGHRVAVTGALESYTRTTIFRLQVSVWRRKRFRTVDLHQLHPYAEPTHDPTEQVPTAVVLHNALARLPARQRAVVVLRFFEDASVAETAGILRCGAGTVKSQTAKALAKLRELVPQLDLQPEGGRRE
jgi:RNA polymerase sigma-70 factor (sigma-E family)